MTNRNGASLFGRVALLLLTLYAIAMIAPDLLRVVRPLGSFGLGVDGDGRIYDVRGPFESEDACGGSRESVEADGGCGPAKGEDDRHWSRSPPLRLVSTIASPKQAGS